MQFSKELNKNMRVLLQKKYFKSTKSEKINLSVKMIKKKIINICIHINIYILK